MALLDKFATFELCERLQVDPWESTPNGSTVASAEGTAALPGSHSFEYSLPRSAVTFWTFSFFWSPRGEDSREGGVM
jgi:hypothetical protein